MCASVSAWLTFFMNRIKAKQQPHTHISGAKEGNNVTSSASTRWCFAHFWAVGGEPPKYRKNQRCYAQRVCVCVLVRVHIYSNEHWVLLSIYCLSICIPRISIKKQWRYHLHSFWLESGTNVTDPHPKWMEQPITPLCRFCRFVFLVYLWVLCFLFSLHFCLSRSFGLIRPILEHTSGKQNQANQLNSNGT